MKHNTLLYAVRANNLPKVRELLEAETDADMNQRNSSGETILHLAARAGSPHIISLLLSHGADVNAVSNNGFTCIQAAAHIGHAKAAELMIDSGGDVNAKSDNRATALHHATHTICGTEILKLLISKGADVNAADADGRTPLDYALYMEREDVAEVLLKYGAIEGTGISFSWRRS